MIDAAGKSLQPTGVPTRLTRSHMVVPGDGIEHLSAFALVLHVAIRSVLLF